jgi:hypothetical protein
MGARSHRPRALFFDPQHGTEVCDLGYGVRFSFLDGDFDLAASEAETKRVSSRLLLA